AGIVGLLTVFMAPLYDWQLAASGAEREQRQRRVEADTKALADEFNREIQGAYFKLQSEPAGRRNGNASALAEGYAPRKTNRGSPDLINGIYVMPDGSAPLRFDPDSKALSSPTADDANLARIKERLTATRGRSTIADNGFTLAIPLVAKETKLDRIMIRRTPGEKVSPPEPASVPLDVPEPAGHVVVLLNEAAIKEKVLPELAAKHFPNGDFGIAVVDRAGSTVFQSGELGENRDAQAGLLDLTPDHLIWDANREVLPRRTPGKDAEIVLNQRIETRTIRANDGPADPEAGETFTIQMKRAWGGNRSAVVSGDPLRDSEWKLGVGHTAGSVDAYIRSERNRNLAIGFGIYLLLLGSIVSIVYSSLRAKAFAQRQVDFVSSVSHEFRTPLAVIYSAAENLADGIAKDSDQVSGYGNLIKGEGKKLSAMVEQILEFAGARSGKRKFNL